MRDFGLRYILLPEVLYDSSSAPLFTSGNALGYEIQAQSFESSAHCHFLGHQILVTFRLLA